MPCVGKPKCCACDLVLEVPPLLPPWCWPVREFWLLAWLLAEELVLAEYGMYWYFLASPAAGLGEEVVWRLWCW